MQKEYMRQMGTVDAKMFFYVDSAAKLARKSESEREESFMCIESFS